MSRAGHVLGILPNCHGTRRSDARHQDEHGLLKKKKKDEHGEADKGWMVNGLVCHAKEFILSVMARAGKILSRNKM